MLNALSSSLSWGNWMPICPHPSWTCSECRGWSEGDWTLPERGTGLSLCELQPCDPVSTACMFQDGLAQCPCRPAYRPTPGMGRACTACGTGFWLWDGVCASLPAGAGRGVLRGERPAAAPGESQGPSAEPQPGRASRATFQPQQLSLPRVHPPRPLEEVEIPELGPGSQAHPCCGDRLSLGAGRAPAAGSGMKTFRGSRSSPGSAPRPGGGQSSLVFVSNEEWGQRNWALPCT
ncbi:uncharacterized protein LOC141983450 isoform X1 [Natator depressus]|uniref:uncharacterized protein LOC141983450 isoform X1 n=1 Tax=Natator depressus TaxID=27790 RepID=UPI003EBE9DF7